MALKTRYEKKADIPKGAEEHYNEKDGVWVLDADYEDVTALKNAKEHEKNKRTQAERDLATAQAALNTAQDELNALREGAIPKADADALKASYQKKYETDMAAANAKLEAATAQVNRLVLGTTVDNLAAKLFDKNAVIGKPHIAARLRLEEENGEQVVKVVDKDGRPSALTVADLEKEILQDKIFAGILVGSRALGGGAQGGQGGGGASSKKLSEMNEAERIQFQKEDPVGFRTAIREQSARKY